MSKFVACIESSSENMAMELELDLLMESIVVPVEEDWKDKAKDIKDKVMGRVKEIGAKLKPLFDKIKKAFEALLEKIKEFKETIKKKLNVSKDITVTTNFWYDVKSRDLEAVQHHIHDAAKIFEDACAMYERIGRDGMHVEKNEEYFKNYFEDLDDHISALKDLNPDKVESRTVVCRMAVCNFYEFVVKMLSQHVDKFSEFVNKVEKAVVANAERAKQAGRDLWTIETYQKLGTHAAQLSRVAYSISYKAAEDLTAMNTRASAYVGKGVTMHGANYDKAKQEAEKKRTGTHIYNKAEED